MRNKIKHILTVCFVIAAMAVVWNAPVWAGTATQAELTGTQEDIELNKEVTINWEKNGSTVDYYFTPTENKRYLFVLTDNDDRLPGLYQGDDKLSWFSYYSTVDGKMYLQTPVLEAGTKYDIYFTSREGETEIQFGFYDDIWHGAEEIDNAATGIMKKGYSEDGKNYSRAKIYKITVPEDGAYEYRVSGLNPTGIADDDYDFDVDIYLTGSNSRMMSSEIATYLTGRYVAFRIYTLSFGEYLFFKSHYAEVSDPKQELAEYVRLGGFPGTHLQAYSQDEVYTIVRDIYNSTVFSDIVRRNQIKKVDQLERVVKYVFNNVGNTFSASSISAYLKSERRSLDNETIYSYLDKLESAYLLHRCSRYDLRGKAILKTQEKFYLADVALRYSVLGYNEDSVAASLENVVYLELLRRGYEVNIGKTPDGEVDFVATRQGEKLYVQVTQEITSEKTEKREYERLLEIHDNYPKYVLLTNDFAGGNHEGIQTMHVADFLLSDAY